MTYKPSNVADILGHLPHPVKVDPPMYKGLMIYTGKTGATIQVCKNPDTFNYIKSATDRTAQQSILRKQTPNQGKAI
jgi:hypothetical protein